MRYGSTCVTKGWCATRRSHILLGVRADGTKEILGLWLGFEHYNSVHPHNALGLSLAPRVQEADPRERGRGRGRRSASTHGSNSGHGVDRVNAEAAASGGAHDSLDASAAVDHP